MPLISLRDMPSATIFNDDSKKYEEKKTQKRRKEGRYGREEEGKEGE